MNMEGRRSSKVHRNSVVEEEEEDIIINKLPESLISYILSFLPTKDAIRTCVLSKRWINQWAKSIIKLDIDDTHLSYNYNPLCSFCKNLCIKHCYDYDKFDLTICISCRIQDKQLVFVTKSDAEQNERQVEIDDSTGRKIISGEKEQQFVNFVSRALLVLTNKSSMELEIFSLVINNKRDISLQNTWISAILNHRVKNLRIHSSFYKLPFSDLTSYYLFNSPSLQELELLLHVFSTIKVPTISVHFRHIKLIKLHGIFLNIASSSSNCITLSLPLLKKFDIKNCNWSSGKDLIVQAPLLEIISIEQDNEFCNVVSHDSSPSQSIKFNVLHLKQFTYSGCGIAQLIHLCDRSLMSFDSAEIILKKCNETVTAIKRLPFLLLLFQQFHQVKSIKFEGLDYEVLTKANIPVFSMLRHLELWLVTVEVLVRLLQNSPVLETLHVMGVHNFAEEFLSSVYVPRCMAFSLGFVKFGKVKGDKHELFLAKYFLQNSMTMGSIEFSVVRNRPDKDKVRKKWKEMVYLCKKRPILCFCTSDD